MGDEPSLSRQLEMTEVTWSALQKEGVADGTRLLVEFSYEAPSEHLADRLVESLSGDVITVSSTSGKTGLLGRRRVVGGVAGYDEVDASLSTLKRWVTAMVERGRDHGCAFDGWGAEL